MTASADRHWARWIAWSVLGCILAAALYWYIPKFLEPSVLRQGQQAYEVGNWQQAATSARVWLSNHPKDTDGTRLLARALFRLGRDQSARDLYERLGISAMQAEDCARLAAHLSRSGQPSAALRVLEEGLAKDSGHAETLSELARLYAASDRLYEACSLADRLAAVPGWKARASLINGMLRLALDDPEASEKLLEEALKADPELKLAIVTPDAARKLLARAHLSLRKPAEAYAAISPLLDAGSDREAEWLLSRIRLQAGDRPAAIAASARGPQTQGKDLSSREPAPFVGAQRCAPCHQAIYDAQEATHHATTFLAGTRLHTLNPSTGPIVDPAEPSVTHRWLREPIGLSFQTSKDDESSTSSVKYVFGSNDRGATPVGTDEAGVWRELRLSHYGDAATWDLTTGHPATPPDAASGHADAYLGRVLTLDSVRRCLDCHTTNLRAATAPNSATANDRGIGCERCHGPGGNHLLAVAAAPDFPELAIARPNPDSGEQVMNLCTSCHSPRGMDVRRDDPTSIRFQGTTLTWSRCYTESLGALSCVSCHDPHRDAVLDAAYYETKCLACHGAQQNEPAQPPAQDGARPIQLPDQVERVACPVNAKSGCIGCHMPKRAGIIAHTTFADHWIRVHPKPDLTDSPSHNP